MAKIKAVVKVPGEGVKKLTVEEQAEKKETAAFICGPVFAAHRVMDAVDGKGWLRAVDDGYVIQYLREQVVALKGGDLSQVEAMLMSQATALQSLFSHLVETGMAQSLRENIEMFMKMALRAQNQCRATLETLATIKNPPNVSFVKQANIAHGAQQVNNGAEATPPRENKIEQTQLLEGTPNAERLDFGTAPTAIGNDKEMATVGAINRATNKGREKGKFNARV